jgi:hypothetical protein
MTQRGTGRTTRQMQALRKGGYFVWLHSNIYYPRQLALKLGRGDIKIMSPEWVLNRRWEGLKLPDLVLDHAMHTVNFRNQSELSLFWNLVPHVQARVRPA